jgi:hypothetical protein
VWSVLTGCARFAQDAHSTHRVWKILAGCARCRRPSARRPHPIPHARTRPDPCTPSGDPAHELETLHAKYRVDGTCGMWTVPAGCGPYLRDVDGAAGCARYRWSADSRRRMRTIPMECGQSPQDADSAHVARTVPAGGAWCRLRRVWRPHQRKRQFVGQDGARAWARCTTGSQVLAASWSTRPTVSDGSTWVGVIDSAPIRPAGRPGRRGGCPPCHRSAACRPRAAR